MNRAALRVSLLLPLLLLPALGRADSEQEHGGEETQHSAGKGHSHWSYEDLKHWSTDYPECGGTKQSPINVDTAQAIFSPDLRPIQLSGYSLPANQLLKLKNNGHTVVLELPDSLALAGGYAQQYRAAQLHLHWGSPAGPGSEHTVNGRRFAAEIHVVHYNTKYDSFTEAMVHPDGLAVLGAFLEVGHGENQYYHEILKHLHEIQEVGQETLVPGFNIAGLLPANLKLYFHYNGSLTTPPCYQTVKWTVFNQTMLLSHHQMSVLVSTLKSPEDELLQNNYRPVQSLHGRQVLASFQTTPSVKHTPGSDDSATAEGHSSSFHAGDVLAVLFGVLFAVTALAFLLYIYKHRSQNARLDSPTKSKVIYTAASTENTA
ncbi:carbonic anhydrase 9-like isoform X2 [Camarhynchus parvulus]|uniref:Carbonic anhydrase n=1 Tax=Geospiza parvula TaxID=87175 RepID=A0A8C3MQ28_GEOPR|nr:carbonic anhydrase 9-like isoform X2 [Camarhynchus parvulus]